MKEKRVLAIASTGGHWLQLQRLRPAFEGCKLCFVSTANYQNQISEKQYVVKEANQWDKIGLVIMALQILLIYVKVRPSVVISTGAAPGFFGLLFGKLLGAKTIWVDSIANGEEMSLSGKKCKKIADMYLTQWPEVAKDEGPIFRGAVI
jgi:UDP-N-acetylglucosamine:LPS N-acetylglucosamine transferase